MKVEISGLTVFVENLNELELLVKRYGVKNHAKETAPGDDQPEIGQFPPSPNGGGDAGDLSLLARFVAAREVGVPLGEIGRALGKRGRAIRPAAATWAVRAGIATPMEEPPFEDSRPYGGRGLRLKSEKLMVARKMLEDGKK